jgi:uncharacterized membrane protein
MVVKIMAQQKFCQQCNQKHDCQKIYQQLGDHKGPSVVIKVIVAFLLPLLVFIASLAAFDEMFAGSINIQPLRTALCFLLALLATFVCISITGMINRRLHQIE